MFGVKKEEIELRAVVGSMSLVGILTDDYPLSFGNYFWFASGPRCINMWAENLEEIARRKAIITIDCTQFSDGSHTLAFVTDKRVPQDWLIKDRLCVTGYGWGSRRLCEACHDFAGLPTRNTLCGCELSTDPPKIIHSFGFQNPIHRFTCQHCGRTWECIEEAS